MLKKLFQKFTSKPDIVHCYSAGISDVGRIRDHNEDNFLIDERLGLFIVADGMGGHEAGEVASKLVIETLITHLREINSKYKKVIDNGITDMAGIVRSLLQDAIEDANNQSHCHNIAKGFPEGKGMGSTLTGLFINSLNKQDKKKIYLFNVGDSRVYSFKKGCLKQLTSDHSLYQLWLNNGKQGIAPKSNIIYKAIGPWKTTLADQRIIPVDHNELFLLCSDGLSDMLSDSQIETILKKNKNSTLKKMSQILVDSANRAGGSDNITVVLVKP